MPSKKASIKYGNFAQSNIRNSYPDVLVKDFGDDGRWVCSDRVDVTPYDYVIENYHLIPRGRPCFPYDSRVGRLAPNDHTRERICRTIFILEQYS